jgi:hypothetical protein
MPYDPARTPSLIACLQKEPRREFTASELKDRTAVPKTFVRRALTVDAAARVPTDGVTMAEKNGRWHFSWTGAARAGRDDEASKTSD